MIIVLLGVVLYAFCKWQLRRYATEEPQPKGGSADCASCSESATECKAACLGVKEGVRIEYFDDEDLDIFRGRKQESYTEEETAEFLYVLDTMRREDIRPWLKSLSLRSIHLPKRVIEKVNQRLNG